MAEIKTKFINDPEQITPELLEGYVLAYPDQVKLAAENCCTCKSEKRRQSSYRYIRWFRSRTCIERFRWRRYAGLFCSG